MAKAANRAEKPNLEPLDPIGQRFLSHFHHGWGFIYAPTPKVGERPHWQTENRYPLQPRNLWQQYLDKSVLLGLRFSKETSYSLIDLDRKSKLHPANNYLKYQQLLGCLEEIGLCRPVPIQSSDSGGLHIYYFFEEKQPSFLLACAIKQTLEAADLKIKGGELEIFPNCKVYSYGRPSSFNAHRLPLQAGSYLLDDSLEPWSMDICDLMDAADWSATGQDYSALTAAISQSKFKKIIKFPYRQRSARDQWQHDIEQRMSEGWTGHGQTNSLLKDIACHGIVFRQLSGQALVDYIVITACQSPGYQQWCRHQHEIELRAREWARCCEGFYTPYPGTPKRINSYKEQFGTELDNKVIYLHPNEERQQQTIERISTIVAQLQQTGAFSQKTSERARAIIAASKAQYGIGVSQTTLHKPIYLSLWHPDHQQPEETKQRVNAIPERDTEILPPLKYPQLPDPWIEEQQAQNQTEPELQTELDQIYTPPPYMKVLYMSCQMAAPSASDSPALNQGKEQRLLPESCNCLNPSNSSNSSDSLSSCDFADCLDSSNSSNSLSSCDSSNCLNSFNFPDSLDYSNSSDSLDYSRISNALNDKQNQCLENASELFNNNKQDLSKPQIDFQSNEKDLVQGIDTTDDSSEAIAPLSECEEGAKPSVLVSQIASYQLDTGSSSPHIPTMEQSVPPNEETLTEEDYRQATRLKLQAFKEARHWVKVYCTIENLFLLPQERINMEQLVIRLLMLKSPSQILQQEAQQWLQTNPDALEMAERLKHSKNAFFSNSH
ncbi:hypothetical protein H6G64_35965 [Calothrix sp. FACHB-156]|nr:hypothetical protein [Calothrix sp. FACHB-156]